MTLSVDQQLSEHLNLKNTAKKFVYWEAAVADAGAEVATVNAAEEARVNADARLP